MATDPTSLPSLQDLQKTKEYMDDIDDFVRSSNNTLTDTDGRARRTITGINSDANSAIGDFNNNGDIAINQFEISADIAIDALESSRGYNDVGTFAAGFTYENFNDVGRDDNGNPWVYLGDLSSGNTHVVSPGTIPSSFPLLYEQRSYSDHEELANRNKPNAHLSESITNDDGLTSQDTHDALKATLKAQGLSGDFGLFAKGFSYSDVGDVGIDVDGKIYTYAGSDTLPVNVVPETNPVGDSDYQIVNFKNEPFETVAAMRAYNYSYLPTNETIEWDGYYVKGDGGGNKGLLKRGDSTSLTDDGGSIFIIVNDVVNGIWIKAHDKASSKCWGVRGVGEETQQVQRFLDYYAGKGNFPVLYGNKDTGYLLTAQILFPSNLTLYLSPDLEWWAVDTLEQIPPNFEAQLRFQEVEKCKIVANGAVLKMNNLAYSSQHSHNIMVNGSKAITIENINTEGSGGDGIYVSGYNTTLKHSDGVLVKDSTFAVARRNPCSIISARNVLFDNCHFKDTVSATGVFPLTGVDIEVETYTDALDNIVFRNCKSSGNGGRGAEVNLDKLNTDVEVDIVFENFKSSDDYAGIRTVKCPDGAVGSVVFKDSRLWRTDGMMIAHDRWSSKGVKVYHYNPKVFDSNLWGTTLVARGSGAVFFVGTTAGDSDIESIGGITVINGEYTGKTDKLNPESGAISGAKYIHKTELFQPTTATTGVPVKIEDVYFIDNHYKDYQIEPWRNTVTGSKVFTKQDTIKTKAISGLNLGLFEGSTFTNLDATGDFTVNLPDVVIGYKYRFIVMSPFRFKINTGSEGGTRDNLYPYLTPSNNVNNGDVVFSDAVGSTLEIEGMQVSATEKAWVVTHESGQWMFIDNDPTVKFARQGGALVPVV